MWIALRFAFEPKREVSNHAQTSSNEHILSQAVLAISGIQG